MSIVSESKVEEAALEIFTELGWAAVYGPNIAPEGAAPERESYANVVLKGRLRAALERLNPDIPSDAREAALKKITSTDKPSLFEENRRLHKAVIDGVHVEFRDKTGDVRNGRARLIDFEDPGQNDWLAVNQFTVIENGNNRRPDIVLFINGLPLGVIELKNPGDESATLSSAYNQLQTYKNEIPSLFRANEVLVTSDGTTARIGSFTANEERFMRWRTTDSASPAPAGTPEMETLIEGVFEKRRFLDLVHDFIVSGDNGGDQVKIIAGYHQFHAVHKAVRETLRAMPEAPQPSPGPGMREEPAVFGLPDAKDSPAGDKRIGVIWHTQGSGKSLLMAFYAGKVITHPAMGNPTLVVLTDRNDLDEQLFKTFAKYEDLLRQPLHRAKSREHLREFLSRRAAGGVIFTTIQKFSPDEKQTDHPVLTDRRNVVIISDEAHRSQYGLDTKFNEKTGKKSYGFAKFLRDALPNASLIGFTGTPIETVTANTKNVFGEYIDVYDINQSVEDESTVKIYYESRLARIKLPDEEKEKIDAAVEELAEDETPSATVEALVGADNRLEMVAGDLVKHFEDRLQSMGGKGMIVCMSRRICAAMYDEIVKLRPEWGSDDPNKGAVKVVMTGGASDPPEWKRHIADNKMLATRIKKDDTLKLVIVCDMWLTGFDVPAIHTMYLDKPMKGHTLMQAIARVNRVFRGKGGGLVVDYIGVAQNLKEALGQYTAANQKSAGIDQAVAVAVMQEKYEIVKAIYHGFDYMRAFNETGKGLLRVMSEAIEWILKKQREAAEKETSDEARKKAHRRYQDAVLALSKAFALASASDEAREIRDEVAFFQAVRAAFVKSGDVKSGEASGKSAAGHQLALQQIINGAVVSTGIIDILAAAGFEEQKISILSDEFLADIQKIKQKNLAIEALKKLLQDEISSRSLSNVVESKKFSELLESAIARYHINALTTTELIQEMIGLAKNIKAARRRGEEEGLSDEEVAFYTALALNDSAVQVMGDEKLRFIAYELLKSLKSNAPVDWRTRESARARMRMMVKRILRDHGYPPDLQEEAVRTVLEQAEGWAELWTARV